MNLSLLNKSKLKSFVIQMILVSVIYTFLSSAVVTFLYGDSVTKTEIEDLPEFLKIISLFILGPLIETIIFSYTLIGALSLITENKIIWLIVPSLIFGLVHYYNFIYIFYATIAGAIYNYSYVKIKISFSSEKAVILVSIIHALTNLCSYLVNLTLAS